MPTHTITHQWNLHEKIDFANLAFTKLLFWNEGMSIFGFNEANQIVASKHVDFTKKMNPEDFENILLDEALLGGDEPIQQILLISEKNTIIPKQLFHPEQAKEWIKNMHFVENNEYVEVSHLSFPAGYVLDVMKDDFVAVLHKHFPNTPVAGFTNHLITSFDKNTFPIGLTLLENKMILQTYKDGKLQSFQFGTYDEALMLLIIEEFAQNNALPQEAIKISLNGYGSQIKAAADFLTCFFAVELPATDEAFLNSLAVCE